MYKPKNSPICLQPNYCALPETFSLVVWNLQKTDFSHFTHRTIDQLLPIHPAHLLSLQETAIQPQQNTFFNLPFYMAPNIQTPKKLFGVLTASAYQQSAHHQCLTQCRELGLTTHKTALITQHLLANGQYLTHVNIHAINFVPHHLFKKELLSIWHKIQKTTGPLIISGDFNTWNQARFSTLIEVTKKLNLTQVKFADVRPIKTLNRQALDHIFYRGLTLQDATALSVPQISDHNPLLANFQLT